VGGNGCRGRSVRQAKPTHGTTKEILHDFSDISGLRCNTEKTALMQIGNKIPASQEIIDLGFDITDRVHILGMEIDSNLSELVLITGRGIILPWLEE
jgi:hypothetical protein